MTAIGGDVSGSDPVLTSAPGIVLTPVEYIMDLEALIRWLALSYSYQDQEGEWHVNDPIWTVYDEHGTHLPAAEKLQETWDKVMHADD